MGLAQWAENMIGHERGHAVQVGPSGMVFKTGERGLAGKLGLLFEALAASHAKHRIEGNRSALVGVAVTGGQAVHTLLHLSCTE